MVNPQKPEGVACSTCAVARAEVLTVDAGHDAHDSVHALLPAALKSPLGQGSTAPELEQ